MVNNNPIKNQESPVNNGKKGNNPIATINKLGRKVDTVKINEFLKS